MYQEGARPEDGLNSSAILEFVAAKKAIQKTYDRFDVYVLKCILLHGGRGGFPREYCDEFLEYLRVNNLTYDGATFYFQGADHSNNMLCLNCSVRPGSEAYRRWARREMFERAEHVNQEISELKKETLTFLSEFNADTFPSIKDLRKNIEDIHDIFVELV